MHKTLFSGAAAAAVLLFGASALAMGGGGGYGGGGMPMMQPASIDEYSVALRLIKHEQYAKAIPHLEAALRKRPQDADILNYLGYTHRMVGMGESDTARDDDFKRSLDFYQAALSINPSHRGVHEYLGELYLQMHNLNSAHHEMNVLVILCPDGCDERDTLNKAILAYAPPPETPAAAPAATAAPAPTASATPSP